ncbi:MAG TPA: hypothetical protein VI542_28315 [Candidatus Tectomicrobia bacterium]
MQTLLPMHLIVALICGTPLVARAQLVEPFQRRPQPELPLSQDVQEQLARKRAGDQLLAAQGYRPTMDPRPMHAGRNRPASFTTSVGAGRHAIAVYPSNQCTNATLHVRPGPADDPYPTQDLKGAPVVYLEVQQTRNLFIRVDSSDRSCGFQFVIYDRR